MKRFSLAVSFLLFSVFYGQQSIPFNFSEYVLENGMSLFAAEDFSNATVRLEFSVKAGISRQTPDNTGYFTLYTRLLKAQLSSSENKTVFSRLDAQCTQDSSRFILSLPPSKLHEALEILSSTVFNSVFSDRLINQELSVLKTEVMQYANSPAGFINSSIDSRIFQDAPWKHDSGIYPSLFASATPTRARSILNQISKNYYNPENCALFISGAIKKQDALYFAEQTFGQAKKQKKSPAEEKIEIHGKQKKFVIYDSQFSEEISQAIVQYTTLDMNQADILAEAFNLTGSPFKQSALTQKALNIRGDEYINCASAHKSGNSRLIFQTLLEASKTNPVKQSELFLETVKNAANITESEIIEYSKNLLNHNFLEVSRNSKTFMDYLSQFWAIEKLLNLNDEGGKTLAQQFLQRPELISSSDFQTISEIYSLEEPFVFLLVNSKNYIKYKNEFKKAGYEAVNISNGSWYTQKLYKNASSSLKEEKTSRDAEKLVSISDWFNQYYENNQNMVEDFTLSNGIPVSVKKNPSTVNCLIMIGIKGGKMDLSSPEGFNSVMTNAFASNIQNEILKSRYFGNIKGNPEVLAETDWSYSTISVECTNEDFSQVIQCISDSLIYGEIMPADADSYVYSVQTQKRLYNASTVNQLTSRAIKFLYSDPKYRKAFDSENDILENTTYTDILSSYTKFLNASLYNIVVTGNFETEKVKNDLSSTFGLLVPQNRNTSKKDFSPVAPNFSKSKKIPVKLRHLFYTDVKAEDAGPMPAVLIPTKDFSDPVQYWVKSPAYGSKEFLLFQALTQYYRNLLEENAIKNDGAASIQLNEASSILEAAFFTLINVTHTSKADSIFFSTLKELKASLADENLRENVTEEIKNSWLLENLSLTETNRGTSLLLNKSFHAAGKSSLWLENYRTIASTKPEEFLQVLNDYFPEEFQLKLYSTDSKK